MPKKVERYLTRDGQLFEHLQDALRHESEQPVLKELSDFIDDVCQDEDEYFDSESIARMILNNYTEIRRIMESSSSAKSLRRKLQSFKVYLLR